jgi:putative heme-binding domain-containing protein
MIFIRQRYSCVFIGLCLTLASVPSALRSAPVELRDGDVVAFLGGTNMVRGQRAAYLETALTRRYVKAKPRFRDMAWEGDTVFKQGTVAERWRKEKFGDWPAQLERVDATVVVAQFGQLESLRGDEGLGNFVEAYERLLAQIEKRTKRVVLVSPTPFEKGPGLLRDPVTCNADLQLYVDATRVIAKRRKLVFVDVFQPLRDELPGGARLTTDGTHLDEPAHRMIAAKVARAFDATWRDDTLLREAVVEKHRLWYNYWRPANWKCLYGDDGKRVFGKAAGDSLTFRDEWKRFPSLIEKAEERVWRVVDRDSVEAELSSFQTADGLSVNLFASEADGIVNPIAIRWDPRGRLWVACTVVYPQIEPGEKPNDRIVILEDTDDDGRSDKSIVFAEGLNIPTGMELGGGGVYVGQGTELIHLRDTDGDDRADERRIVLSGFGNGDSHQTINTFVWSPGGELLFCQGDGIESRVETPWGISSLFMAGAFRLRPRTLQLDGLLDGFMGPGNPWGIAFDDWGQVIIIDGAGGISFLSPAMLPTSHFLRLPRIGKPGGYCGVEVIGGEHLPEEYQGHFLLGDYHKNMVSRFALRPAGSGYAVDFKEPIIRSKHRSFRPVDVRTGPDGGIYIADWYNTVICHQDVSYRHPDRDKTHGRIWRVTTKDRAALKKPTLVGVPIEATLDGLKSPERWTRYQTKRVIEAMSPEYVAKALAAWTAKLDVDDSAYERHLFAAIGAYETIGVPAPELLDRLLAAKDHRARAYAARVVARWHEELEDPLGLLEKAVSDRHPLVRMEAIVACGSVPSSRAVEVASIAVDRPTDRFIDYALTQAIHMLRRHWMPAFEAGRLTFGGDVRRLAAVLKRVRSSKLSGSIRRLATADGIDSDARRALLRSLLAVGDAKELRFAFERDTYTRGSTYDESLHADVLSDLAQACRRRGLRPHGDLATPLRELIAVGGGVRARAFELASEWGVDAVAGDVHRAATDVSVDEPTRKAAISALAKFGGDEATAALKKLAAGSRSLSIRTTAVAALADVDLKGAALEAAKLISGSRADDIDLDTVLHAFLSKANGAEVFAAAVEGHEISSVIAEALLQAMGAVGRMDESLSAVFRKSLGERGGQELEHSRELVEEIRRAAKLYGDAARGELVFRSAAANCYACHRIGGAGGWIGPDLSAVGTTLPMDRIVEEVLWPLRHVKEGYTSVVVATKDGRLRQGYEETTRENRGELLLRELISGELLRIPRASIVLRQEAGSAMPPGLTASLTRKELHDLLRFLSELGAPGPFEVGQAPIVRRWESLPRVPERIEPASIGNAMWKSSPARVSGALDLADVTSVGSTRALVRTKFAVTHAGRCQLELDDTRGLRIWVDGRSVEPASSLALDLADGEHVLMILVDREKRSANRLRVEWGTGDGVTGRVRSGPVLIPR